MPRQSFGLCFHMLVFGIYRLSVFVYFYKNMLIVYCRRFNYISVITLLSTESKRDVSYLKCVGRIQSARYAKKLT